MPDVEPTTDFPIGFRVLNDSDWDTHSWLSQLERAPDMEMDSAVFWIGLNQEQTEALKQIVVQYRITDKSWENAPDCENASFPSRAWSQASWGWYWPFFVPYGDYEMRALIPDGWIAPDFGDWKSFRDITNP